MVVPDVDGWKGQFVFVFVSNFVAADLVSL